MPRNAKKNHGISEKQHRLVTHFSYTTTDPCLHSTQQQCRIVCNSKSSRIGPKNVCFIFISVWLFGSASKWALKTWYWWGCCREEPRISQCVMAQFSYIFFIFCLDCKNVRFQTSLLWIVGELSGEGMWLWLLAVGWSHFNDS